MIRLLIVGLLLCALLLLGGCSDSARVPTDQTVDPSGAGITFDVRMRTGPGSSISPSGAPGIGAPQGGPGAIDYGPVIDFGD